MDRPEVLANDTERQADAARKVLPVQVQQIDFRHDVLLPQPNEEKVRLRIIFLCSLFWIFFTIRDVFYFCHQSVDNFSTGNLVSICRVKFLFSESAFGSKNLCIFFSIFLIVFSTIGKTGEKRRK